jgi:gliding motility-associated-like protein
MKNLLIFTLLLFLNRMAFGQSSFVKTIDATNFGRNVRVLQTNDQGIAVFSLDSLQLYKFNSCGNPEWAKRYKIPIGFYPGNILKTRNGGFALLNRIPNGPTLYHTSITLLSDSGTVVWSKSLEDPNYIQFPYTISEDPQGNFIILGNASPLNQQGYFNAITKLDANGNLLWTKFYQFGPIWGGALVTSDNGILARIGSTLFKTDNAGNLTWATSLPNTTSYPAPIEVSDGYIFTGTNTGFNQIHLFKIDKTGNLLLGGRKSIDFTGNPPALYKKSNGNFVGTFNKPVSGQNYASIIEFDKDLNIVQQNTLNNIQTGFPLQGLHAGFSDENHTLLAGLVIANAAGSKLFFAKTNNLLRTGCDTTFATNIVTEPVTQTFNQNSNTISHTFNLVNKPFPVKNIPAPTTTLCSNFVPAKLNIHSDSLLCTSGALTLQDKSGNGWSNHLWSTGETTPAISVTKPGKYWLSATYNCSSQTVSDTVTIIQLSFPQPALTQDTAICQSGPVLINATLPGATYRWQDGSTNAIYQATIPGKYEVEITLGNCRKTFSTQIGDFEKLIMPNIFTPNNDGRNDTFMPVEMCGIASGTLKIFNRWGQLIFETSEISKGWNGRVNGSKSADGVYFYLVEYSDFRGQGKKKKGWLELVGN